MFDIMDERDFKNLFPNSNGFDINEMDAETRENYFLLTSAYRHYLTKYLEENISLSKYDKELESSELSFLTVDKEEMDYYQRFNSDDYKYLYLRNNVYIGNLSSAERDELLELINKSKLEYNEEIGNFIEKTYRKVIFEGIKNDEVLNVNFGPISESFFAPNNALVFGVRYDEYASNGKSDEEWDKNHDLQIQKLDGLIKKITTETEKTLDIPVRVLQYDKFSVVKKNNGMKK